MAKKKVNDAAVEKSNGDENTIDILSSRQEVADELKISLYQLYRMLNKYPFGMCGVSGKVMGRWKVTRADVHRWFRYVQRQELRHPDARRMRPEEPPALTDIKGRQRQE